MKKRFFSLVMALCMALALVLPASAAGTGWGDALGDLSGAGSEKLYILMILNSATSAKENVVTSADGSDVYTWQKWVTPEVMADFEQKLDTAHVYYLSYDSHKEEASLAALNLQSAITSFKNAQKPGYKTDDTTTPVTPEEPTTPEQPTVLPFSDVAEGDWYYEYVSKTYTKGLFAGYEDGTFRPQSKMTYGQFLAVLSQFKGGVSATGTPWYAPYVDWAKENGLIPSAILKDFDPTAYITRQDMAAIFGLFLAKFEVKYTPVTTSAAQFSDQASISTYAAGGVTTCWQAGIMGGNANGSFNPTGTATRAEVAVTMVQLARIMVR